MSYAPTSPVTGSAQTGFTNPTYTISSDTAPSNQGKQHAVTALGGTQVGVTTHTVSSPFTITFTRPSTLKILGTQNANGQYSNIPKNTYKFVVRKGATPALNNAAQVALVDCAIVIPAGTDTYDSVNIRAMLSAAIGVLQQVSAGIGDSTVTGIL
jgi:hypothetical protein